MRAKLREFRTVVESSPFIFASLQGAKKGALSHCKGVFKAGSSAPKRSTLRGPWVVSPPISRPPIEVSVPTSLLPPARLGTLLFQLSSPALNCFLPCFSSPPESIESSAAAVTSFVHQVPKHSGLKGREIKMGLKCTRGFQAGTDSTS